MKFCTRIFSLVTVTILISFSGQAVFAEKAIIFSTAPTQSVEDTKKKYQPIADYLTKVIGRKVKLVPAENFIEYSRALIGGKYDLVFDGPQFVAWRMERDNSTRHKVLVKLPGKLRYVVVVRKDLKITSTRRLAGKKVCALASPNLLTLGFLNLFSNPSSMPVMTGIENFKKGLACAINGRGVAVILRDKFWNKISQKKPKLKRELKLFYTAKEAWPHRAFSISSKVDSKTRLKIQRALLSSAALRPARAILKQYKAKRFVPASSAEYAGYGRLLKPIWGFHEQ
ncbi:hypothetical protein MNBD_GAMMA12-3833 [hydrothermal vent metagenome]|uniref:Phosphate/phosphite/phosphonate ABC transporter substrate-binding protein n=1 Tax=hydrothermal vent metagenome TaxID=652676 RepID=A0A3B0YQY2_9ZZZZ